MDIKKLIEEVLADLGNNQPLDSIASKVQIIARLLKNDVFQQWVSREFLHGYDNADELPDYRKSKAISIKADYLVPMGFAGMMSYTNTDIPIMNLGKKTYDLVMEIKFFETVGSIQKYQDDMERVCISLSPIDKVYIQKVIGEAQILSGHKEIAPSSLKVIVDNVRARLIDIFMDFNEQLFDNQIDFNAISKKEDISNIVNNYINPAVVNSGDGNITMSNTVVSSGHNNTVNVGEASKVMNDVLDRIINLSGGQTEISEIVDEAKEELRQAQPKKGMLSMALRAIKGIAKTSAISGIDEIVEEGILSLSLFG